MHLFFCWIPYSLKNSLTKFENFLSIGLTGWKLSQPVQRISVEVHYSSRFKFRAPELVLVISPSSELEIMHCFFFFGFLTLQGTLCQILRFFLNLINQLGTVQSVCGASLRGALFLLILGPKSYLVQAHKPQISHRHGLGPVLGHVMGFLQPTLGPLGYLLVKKRSKCGQLWTLGIKECLWSWGSPRQLGGVPGTEGAQIGVSVKRKERRKEEQKT